MCTVTYLPLTSGDYILSSNRDEQAARSPRRITRRRSGRHWLLFPQDTRAGGTWIATASDDRTVCLLNGAFQPHQHKPPYRRSRGLMVLDSFDYPDTEAFATHYDFTGMEPFTMILLDRGRLRELRWDESSLHDRKLDAADYYIWSSATLYDEAARSKRERWFRNWRSAHEQHDLDAILDFHHHAGEGDPRNDVVMDRDGLVQTVSITSIIRSGKEVAIRYEDLLHRQVEQTQMRLHGKVLELP